MHPGAIAASQPGKPACTMAASGETVTYQELDERSARLAGLFWEEGARTGDCVAILMENNAHYLEACWAAQRSGLYYTAISTRLSPPEVAYIVTDSGARAVVTSQAMAGVAARTRELCPEVRTWLVLGEGYEEALTRQPAQPLPGSAQVEGADLLYSSGTTGRPKGIKRPLPGQPLGTPTPLHLLLTGLYGFSDASVFLSPAPLYHAAPLRFCMEATRIGTSLVVMEHFDPEAFLAAIERYRVTHTQVVPTMFVRLLKLDPAIRSRYDLSSLRCCIHAAAPCPVPVKRQMIEWWGPVLHEYYAGTEANGFVAIDSEQWLAHPGSVGRPLAGVVHVTDDDGRELPPGRPGTIWFEGGGQFEYHHDPAATAASRHPAGWTTLGDVGYLDEDGWLYLTDRRAFMIISGGVNIYPQEAENVLIMHPQVEDVAVFGVPNEDYGEEVKAVVQPRDMALAGPDLEAELLAWCRSRLSPLKCPRSVDFEAELPRHPTGKLYKRLLRDRYWAGHQTRIV